MPSQAKPCHCTNCKGALRDPKTVRRHTEKSARIASTSLAQRQAFERAQLGGNSDHDDDNNNDINQRENGELSQAEDNTKAGSQKQNKRRRIDDEILTPVSANESDKDRQQLPEYHVDSDPMDHMHGFQGPEQNRSGNQSDSDEEPLDPNSEYEDEEDLRAQAAALNPYNNHERDEDNDYEHGDDGGGPGHEEDDETPQNHPITQSRIEHVRIAQSFIEAIKSATLDNGKLDKAATERLRRPEEETIDLSDPDLRFSLDLYMSCLNASEATYTSVRQSILRRFPDTNILSHHLAKKLVADTSGVVSVDDDMCINSCHAFTGEFADLDTCSICSEPRYMYITSGNRQKRISRKQMCTIPLGPQIQALRRSVHGASDIRYRDRKTQEIYERLDELEDELDTVYDDIFCGDDILALTECLNLTSDDTTCIFSIDGAQLYQNKKSDTWIGIWIITDYNPATRYRSKHVLPALVVPGPNKPKNVDSYLFRTFHHLSAIQREDHGAGIRVFDAIKKSVVSSRTILLFATADAVGLTEMDGRVGHHGAHGCRKGCEMKGRHKPSSGHYFAAHLRPNNYTVEDCNHPDFDLHKFAFQLTPEAYKINLAKVINSTDQTNYEENRKQTGISKPSILSGLHSPYILQVPLCFTVDLMHLFCLNFGELLIPIWRGTFKCEPTDDKSTWNWATLVGETWKTHGKLVAASTKYFPTFFHRPPRNPAEKISSGYKATEYCLYLFGLGPAFFRTVLPQKYWQNFCKLVRGVHIIMQRSITARQAREAHRYFVQFVEEYENIYYQRRVDRLHFNRPSVHSALHTAPEVFRVGNGCHTDQYTMERAIGDLGKEIRQPSNPFANLCKLALRRAQVNAIKSIYPELDNDLLRTLPQYSCNLGAGYILLRPRDKLAQGFSDAELHVIHMVCDEDKRQRWGRLQLPNGQIARSLFSESKRAAENKRISRNVKLDLDGRIEFAEVQFYFLDTDNDEDPDKVAHAVVSLYGPPNQDMLLQSSHTLYACTYEGQDNLHCIPVTAIVSVISMQPLPRLPDDPENLWFVVEKSGLDDVQLFEHEEVV